MVSVFFSLLYTTIINCLAPQKTDFCDHSKNQRFFLYGFRRTLVTETCLFVNIEETYSYIHSSHNANRNLSLFSSRFFKRYRILEFVKVFNNSDLFITVLVCYNLESFCQCWIRLSPMCVSIFHFLLTWAFSFVLVMNFCISFSTYCRIVSIPNLSRIYWLKCTSVRLL